MRLSIHVLFVGVPTIPGSSYWRTKTFRVKMAIFAYFGSFLVSQITLGHAIYFFFIPKKYADEDMLEQNFKAIFYEITLVDPLIFESVMKTPYPIIYHGL